MNQKTIGKLLAASALALAVSGAQAALIETWDYTLTLEWVTSATVFAPGNIVPGVNMAKYPGGTTNEKDLISWGNRDAVEYWKINSPGDNRSALEIGPSLVTGTINLNSGSVAANMFTHYNSPVYEVYPTLQQAQLAVTIDLALPNSATVFKLTETFQVYFVETPNTGLQCEWGLCDNDIFAILAVSPTLDNFSRSFNVDGIEYTFSYFETTPNLNPLSVAACNEAKVPGGLACYGFTTPESASTQVHFAFSITAVPEPETYAMLLAGLGMVGIVARRRRNTI